MSKEVTFKVIPFCRNLEAPAIYVEANKKEHAMREAKNKSGVGRFSNWGFLAIEIDKKNGKRRKSNMHNRRKS